MLSLYSFLMVHHVSSALPHWEVATFIFNLAYFAGVSLGYHLAPRIKPDLIPRLLPLVLLCQTALLLMLRPLFLSDSNTDK